MSLVIRQCNRLPEGIFALLTRTRNGEQLLRHLECWQTWQTNRLTSRSGHLCSGLTCVSEEVVVVRGDHSGVGVVEAVAAVVAPGGNDQRRVAVCQLRLPWNSRHETFFLLFCFYKRWISSQRDDPNLQVWVRCSARCRSGGRCRCSSPSPPPRTAGRRRRCRTPGVATQAQTEVCCCWFFLTTSLRCSLHFYKPKKNNFTQNNPQSECWRCFRGSIVGFFFRPRAFPVRTRRGRPAEWNPDTLHGKMQRVALEVFQTSTNLSCLPLSSS